jgi:lipopolysaccharide/colanic/teichoic acid biosynthesis glycosyltransferase
LYISGTKDLELAAVAQEANTGADVFRDRAADSLCRVLDVLIASAVLIFVAPLMVVVALAIKIQDGGPIFFGHSRIGYEGRNFRCWKFRSMVVDAEARLAALLSRDPQARREWETDHKLRKDPRITLLGRFLRVSSIDELPQLFNVLKGEMSLVGPRPIVTAEIARYGRRFPRYCSVRPGITGLWQVSGRNDVSYRRRVAMDTVFAKNSSPTLYVKILFATIPAVLRREGSY